MGDEYNKMKQLNFEKENPTL